MGVVQQSRGVLAPASEHLMSEPAIVCRHGRWRRSDGSTTVDWHGLLDDYDRIRDHIEHVVPGLRRSTTAACASRAASTCPTGPREGEFPDAVRARPTSRPPDPEHDLGDGRAAADDASAATTSSTPRSTARTTATAASSAGGGSIFMNADDMRDRSLRGGPVGRHRQPLRRRSAGARRGSRSCPTRSRAAAPPPTTRRRTCSFRWRSVADGSNQPASKSIPITLEASSSEGLVGS